MSDWFWHVPGSGFVGDAGDLSDDEVLDVLDLASDHYRGAVESLAETVIPALVAPSGTEDSR